MELKFNTLLIAPSDTLVVAVSGGVDSMVLLDLLMNLKNQVKFQLFVAHMNYHKRTSSDLDEQFVRTAAKKYGLEMKSFDFADSNQENFQMEARNQRYFQFYQYAKSVFANKLVLAHHNDDQIETILMRLTRGSSFVGYAGIKERSTYKDIELIRPLLFESKENIEKYATLNDIHYQTDESNLTDHYTRNRFRHNIVPLLKEENPKVLEKIQQFSNDISSAYALIQKYSSGFLSKHVEKQADCHSIPIARFLEEDAIVQKDIIIKTVNAISQNQTELSEKNIDLILEMMSSSKPNIQKRISDRIFVYRSYDSLLIQSKEELYASFELVVQDFGKVILPNNDIIDISKNEHKCGGKSIDLWYNNLDSLFPITIRTRRNKDVLTYPFGRKKLKDVLIDKKIPMKIRNTVPIVLDSTQRILYIPDIYKSEESVGSNHLYFSYSKG